MTVISICSRLRLHLAWRNPECPCSILSFLYFLPGNLLSASTLLPSFRFTTILQGEPAGKFSFILESLNLESCISCDTKETGKNFIFTVGDSQVMKAVHNEELAFTIIRRLAIMFQDGMQYLHMTGSGLNH